MVADDPISIWTISAIVCLFLAAVFDAAAWAFTGWGYGEQDTFHTWVGLWQICNNSAGVTESEKTAGIQYKTGCYFPTAFDEEWISKALVMEIMGGFCTMAVFILLAVFVLGLALKQAQIRTIFVAIVPLAFLSGLMNLIGLLTMSLNLYKIGCTPQYCVALDSLGVICVFIGGLSALLDLQGCCGGYSLVSKDAHPDHSN